jgi:hypothetical protein
MSSMDQLRALREAAERIAGDLETAAVGADPESRRRLRIAEAYALSLVDELSRLQPTPKSGEPGPPKTSAA